MYKNLLYIPALLILLISNVSGAVDISENSYLIGHKVGIEYTGSDDQSDSFLKGTYFYYYEGIIKDTWYDFLLIEYSNGESEWISKYSVIKLIDDIRT